MKVVFLDIDGVLNSFQSIEAARRIKSNRQDSIGVNEDCFCPMAISNLNTLFEDIHNLWGVVSSTWRKQYDIEQIRNFLSMAGFLYPWKIFDRTPTHLSNYYRGNEIYWWLSDHAEEYEVNSFVILDDNSDMNPYEKHLVQTNGKHGFMYEDLIKSIAGFNSGEFNYDRELEKKRYER
jgi:hypothetical protein